MTNDELLHKWINGELSEEELTEFKRRPEYESLRELYQNTENLKAPDFNQEQMLAQVLKAKAAAPPATALKSRVRLFSLLKYGVAASLLIFAGWMIFANLGSEVVIQVAQGERQEGQLPDRSTFVLNAESRLRYQPKVWPEKRHLQLQGEAFFRVEKGSRFTVRTKNGAVEVLGTQFNVWSRGETLEVTCRSGRVAVRSKDARVMEELTPGKALRLVRGQLQDRWTVPEGQQSNWVEGNSRFEKVPLARVLEELERHFKVRIDRGQVDVQEIVTCNFSHKSLESALATSLKFMEIDYEIRKDSTIYLRK
ncbi:MAG: FecR domain-containing protein [Bacteroidota bacterium]